MGRRSAYVHKITPEGPALAEESSAAAPLQKVPAFQIKAKLFSTTENISMKAAKQLKKLVVPVTPWSDDLDAMRLQLDRASSQMRTQVYSLSKALGTLVADLKLQEAVERLQAWEEAPSRDAKAVIERDMAYEGSLLVTDMSGFTRITREEGILHFYMLIKQMQSICLPILSRHGGTLLKVEADDLFVLFPSPGYAVQAATACISATQAFSASRTRENDKIILSCGIIDGPMWLIPHLDAFGQTVETGFRIGEDLADKDQVLVHASAKKKIEANGGVRKLPEHMRRFRYDHQSGGGGGGGAHSGGVRDAKGDRVNVRGGESEYYTFAPAAPVTIDDVLHEVWSVEWNEGDDDGGDHAGSPAQLGGRLKRGFTRLLSCCGVCGCGRASLLADPGSRGGHAPPPPAVPGGGAGGGPGGGQPSAQQLSALKRILRSSQSSWEKARAAAVMLGLRSPAARPPCHLSVINAEVNQEEPLDLITMIDERIEACDKTNYVSADAQHAEVAAIDARIISRFLRRHVTVLVMMIHVKTPGNLRGEELRTAGIVLSVKHIGAKAVAEHGGGCIKAMQQRTVPVVLALMPTAVSALEAYVLVLKLCEARYAGKVVLQAGMATGDVLDFEGCNAFGDPVNTAFKLGEDLAGHWEFCVDPTAAAMMPPPLLERLPFLHKRATISGVRLEYRSLEVHAEDTEAALGKIRIASGAETATSALAAAVTMGKLDWTGLVGRGVQGLKMPYGMEQDANAAKVQAMYRARRARQKTQRLKSTKSAQQLGASLGRMKTGIRAAMYASRILQTNKVLRGVREWQHAPWSVGGESLLASHNHGSGESSKNTYAAVPSDSSLKPSRSRMDPDNDGMAESLTPSRSRMDPGDDGMADLGK